jgi:ATP-dependent helicase/nuclease subunit A
LTATELKGRFADYEAAEEAEATTFVKKQRPPILRPAFITERAALTAAERGTALHLAMQNIDFDKCGSLDGILQELRRLKEKSFLSAQQPMPSTLKRYGLFSHRLWENVSWEPKSSTGV